MKNLRSKIFCKNDLGERYLTDFSPQQFEAFWADFMKVKKYRQTMYFPWYYIFKWKYGTKRVYTSVSRLSIVDFYLMVKRKWVDEETKPRIIGIKIELLEVIEVSNPIAELQEIGTEERTRLCMHHEDRPR